MFEIRVICAPFDTERVTTVLNSAFDTGNVRQSPSRDGKRARLYVIADHYPEPGPWPMPEEAYEFAPSIVHEMDWITAYMVNNGVLNPEGPNGREFWVRRAAVLDRIALTDRDGRLYGDANDVALKTARRLLDLDRYEGGRYFGYPYGPDHPEALANPRGYVRQEYAHWAEQQ